MIKIDMITEPGRVKVHWGRTETEGYLRFARENGSTILHIRADYADARALQTAAKVLTFLFREKRH